MNPLDMVFRIIARLLLVLVAGIQTFTTAMACPLEFRWKETRAVEISGAVASSQEFGPPGFGENPKEDSVYTAYFLVLDEPVQVTLFDETPPRHVEAKRITMFPPWPGSLASLVGKHVVTRGLLGNGVLPSELTPVSVGAVSVEVNSRVVCRQEPGAYRAKKEEPQGEHM